MSTEKDPVSIPELIEGINLEIDELSYAEATALKRMNSKPPLWKRILFPFNSFRPDSLLLWQEHFIHSELTSLIKYRKFLEALQDPNTPQPNQSSAPKR